jgi:hypothetical protein
VGGSGRKLEQSYSDQKEKLSKVLFFFIFSVEDDYKKKPLTLLEKCRCTKKRVVAKM